MFYVTNSDRHINTYLNAGFTGRWSAKDTGAD